MKFNSYELELINNIFDSYIENQEKFIIEVKEIYGDANIIEKFVNEAKAIKERINQDNPNTQGGEEDKMDNNEGKTIAQVILEIRLDEKLVELNIHHDKAQYHMEKQISVGGEITVLRNALEMLKK